MNSYATIDDINSLWRRLKPDEVERAEQLLLVVSDMLRVESKKVNKNLDEMLLNDSALRNVAKSVTVDIVGRTLMTSTDSEPLVQSTESALGYSQSSTFLVPGGGVFIKNNELSRLGLKRQRYGVLDMYGKD